MKYVVGFVFDTNNQNILLLEKKRPEWQRGFVNGIGGKVEGAAEETFPVLAMVREAREEAAFESSPSDWHLFHNELHTSGNDLYFYATDVKGIQGKVKSLTDEVLMIVSYDLHPGGIFDKVRLRAEYMLYNLNWLIPMAYCYLKHPEHRYVRG